MILCHKKNESLDAGLLLQAKKVGNILALTQITLLFVKIFWKMHVISVILVTYSSSFKIFWGIRSLSIVSVATRTLGALPETAEPFQIYNI